MSIDDAVEHPNCRLYLAESTIPNAGLGIYTGIDLPANASIAEPDIIVPLRDLEFHTTGDGDDIDYHFLWKDYSWNPSEMDMETDFRDGYALVLGTGCVPNCNFALLNAIEENRPKYDHVGLHRSKDVGISGFTGYYNQRMITTRPIPRGGEIFVDYNEDWFSVRPYLGNIPYIRHYHNVDVFLAKFKYLTMKHNGINDYRSGRSSDGTLFHQDTVMTRDLWDIVKSLSWFGSRNVNALPITFDDVMVAQREGSAQSRQPYAVRTPEWLARHGKCMDNIRPGNSTIPQAGRGAFASRYIPEGGLVAPGPLLHIPNRTSLLLYSEGTADGRRNISAGPIGYQLILNYCLGHARSSVLLCPYTSPSAYINHGSGTRTNVRIVWSNESTTPNHHAHWLDEDVAYLKSMNSVGLSMDFVATRDILPGEEVFLDYGKEWETAWDDYVRDWTPPPTLGSETYASAATIRENEPLWTIQEQSIDPYPDNIIFYCHYDYHPGLEGGEYRWEDSWASELRLIPCQIITREYRTTFVDTVGYYYSTIMLTMDQVDVSTVMISNIDDTDYDDDDEVDTPPLPLSNNDAIPPRGTVHVLTDVPRWAIKVRDKLYSKDEYKVRSFRHEMMIPNDMFPETWKNIL